MKNKDIINKMGKHIEKHPIGRGFKTPAKLIKHLESLGFTKIDYTLEQALAESRRNHNIDRLLEKLVKAIDKISLVQGKQQDTAILFDHRITKLEKMLKSRSK